MEPTWNHEPSAWLRARLLDITARDAAGTMPRCPHVATGRAAVALWSGRATCKACVPSERRYGDEDMTCDRCRALCADVIHPAVMACGRFVVCLGLCADCHRREVAA